MKILLLSGNFPYPLDEGGKVRSFHLLKSLSRIGRVTMLSICRMETEAVHSDKLSPYCESLLLVDKRTTGHLRPQTLKNRIEGLTKGLPWEIQSSYSEDFQDRLRSMDLNQFDLIVTRGVQYAYHLMDKQRYGKFWNRVLIDIDDLLPRASEEKCRTMLKGYARIRKILNTVYLKKLYRTVINCMAMNWVVSQQDADYLRSSGITSRVEVVPNAVALPELSSDHDLQIPENILFCGSLNYGPNSEGLKFFLNEIFPLIRKQIPEACLTVVGRGNPDWLNGKTYQSVTFEGFVPFVEPFYRNAGLAVVPILSGAGSRIKVLEAMAYERAVVATGLGAEGIDGLKPDKNIIVKNTPESFSNACVQLIRDKTQRQKIAKAARQLIEERYTDEVFAHTVNDLIAGMQLEAASV